MYGFGTWVSGTGSAVPAVPAELPALGEASGDGLALVLDLDANEGASRPVGVVPGDGDPGGLGTGVNAEIGPRLVLEFGDIGLVEHETADAAPVLEASPAGSDQALGPVGMAGCQGSA